MSDKIQHEIKQVRISNSCNNVHTKWRWDDQTSKKEDQCQGWSKYVEGAGQVP